MWPEYSLLGQEYPRLVQKREISRINLPVKITGNSSNRECIYLFPAMLTVQQKRLKNRKKSRRYDQRKTTEWLVANLENSYRKLRR
jgi:hypothetical protein